MTPEDHAELDAREDELRCDGCGGWLVCTCFDRRKPENQGRRAQYDALYETVEELCRRSRMRLAIIAAGLDEESD